MEAERCLLPSLLFSNRWPPAENQVPFLFFLNEQLPPKLKTGNWKLGKHPFYALPISQPVRKTSSPPTIT